MRDNRLAGVVLVGDAADSNRYMDWLRTDADLRHAPPQPAVPGARARPRRIDVAEMADA